MAQRLSEIRSLLADAGIHPLKRFGQHFLIDGNLMRKLVDAADPGRDDVVLEVGPGTGSLTDHLLERAGHVVAVEIDNGLHAICRQRFAGQGGLTLMHIDILHRKSAIAPAVLQTLTDQQRRLGGRIMLVANLPYQVATPLLVDLLTGELEISPLCFTVQAEVADRLIAPPGSKTFGQVSVIVQALGSITRIAHVPPEAFWPVPKVDSMMLRLDKRPTEGLSRSARAALIRVLQICFGHRRKTMRSNLRAILNDSQIATLEGEHGWDLSRRPEQISVDEWISLGALLTGLGVPLE